MSRGEETIFEVDGRRLSALRARVSGKTLSGKSLESFVAPNDDGSGADAAFERWAGEQLREAKAGGRVVATVSRGAVVLKILSLPGARELEDGDLAQPVKLQMSRQAVSLEAPLIDYVRLREQEAPGEGDARVLAAALAPERADRLRSIAQSAGAKLSAIALRSIGVAAMLRSSPNASREAILGVAVGPASCELVVLRAGRLVFARTVDTRAPTHTMDFSRLSDESDEAFEQVDDIEDDIGRRIAVEAKRTWMSYRVSPGSVDVESVVVLGEGREAEQLASACAAALDVSGRASGLPEGVSIDSGIEGDARLHAATLMAPLFARARGEPALDFANPRKPTDRAATTRQRVLLSVLGVILVAGAGYVVAQGQLDQLQAGVDSLEEQRDELAYQHLRMLREEARAEYLERWASQRTDWLAHLATLSELTPDSSVALLDSLSGAQYSEIDFAADRGRYSSGRWSERFQAQFTLEGRARDRAISNEFRARLLQSELYGVHSRGPDSATTFGFSLTTDAPAPASATASTPALDEGGES